MYNKMDFISLTLNNTGIFKEKIETSVKLATKNGELNLAI